MAKDVFIIPSQGIIQFSASDGDGTGKIQADGDNLVISNAIGDVLLGDGASDVYIGDVSSMVTEFIIYKPRPCLFINAHDIDWVGNEDYHFWKMGNVVNDANDFPKHIFQSLESNHHEEKQLKMKNNFVHQSSIDSSKTCAKSIQNILRETNT